MSIPVPGNYYIVNSVASTVDASRLAIQFNGKSAALTVEPLVTSDTSQVWTISNYDSNSQTISPKDDSSLQIAFGDKYLTTLPAGAYTWVIRGDDNGNYTFQDGGLTVYWDIAEAKPDQQVVYFSQRYPTEEWWLYHA